MREAADTGDAMALFWYSSAEMDFELENLQIRPSLVRLVPLNPFYLLPRQSFVGMITLTHTIYNNVVPSRLLAFHTNFLRIPNERGAKVPKSNQFCAFIREI